MNWGGLRWIEVGQRKVWGMSRVGSGWVITIIII